MSKLDETLALLRSRGVRTATFHATGELASVRFAPDVADAPRRDAPQHEASAPVKREPRAAGGLVPRVQRDDSSS